MGSPFDKRFGRNVVLSAGNKEAAKGAVEREDMDAYLLSFKLQADEDLSLREGY